MGEELSGAHLDLVSTVVHAPPLPAPHCSIPTTHTAAREGGVGANREGREGVTSEREERDSLVSGGRACVGVERGSGIGHEDEREGKMGRGRPQLGYIGLLPGIEGREWE